MNKTKISVITPSYNQGQFIEQTIRSIWDQEGDFYIQHIIADGGSSDNTVALIKKLEKELNSGKYPVKCKGINLIWWSRKDDGQAAALNEGFAKADGEIFCWLNSDDFYESGALKKVDCYFKKHPKVDFLYGDMNFVDIKGKLIRKCDYLIDFSFWRLQNSCYICQPSTFWRKKVYEKVGELNANYHYAFDYDYWLRIGLTKEIAIKRVSLGVLSSLRTYKTRKTESGLSKPWREMIKILASKRLFFSFGIMQALCIIAAINLKKCLQIKRAVKSG